MHWILGLIIFTATCCQCARYVRDMKPKEGELDFRFQLHGDQLLTYGYVEMQYQGFWGRICTGWAVSDAVKMCKKLGFTDSHTTDRYALVTLPTNELPKYRWGSCNWNSTVWCEKGVWNKDGIDACANHAIGVYCEPTQVRLQGSTQVNQGVVEVYIDYRWQAVSGDGWGKQEAMVTCLTLGFRTSSMNSSSYVVQSTHPDSSQHIVYSCAGNETDLALCNRHKSTSGPLAGVNCGVTQLRMTNGSDNSGRLEVYRGTNWMPVCGDSFNVQSARVACRTMGYNGTSADIRHLTAGTYGNGIGTFQFGRPHCLGTELDYSSCPFSTDANGCLSNLAAAVHCGNTEIRLVGSNNSWEGRVEVKHNGKYGSVCADGFDLNAAKIICKMLGYRVFDFPPEIFNSKQFGAGNGSVMLDDLHCLGSEKDIEECKHNGWGNSDCFHYEDMGIRCPHIDVRLHRTWLGPWQGYVEVFHKGRWAGVIASSDNSYKDAATLCKILGFDPTLFNQGTVKIINLSSYVIRPYTSWFSRLRCRDDETDVGMCYRGSFPSSQPTSGRFNALAISCPRPGASTPVRLVNGSPWEGSVQVYNGSEWAYICDRRFSRANAEVVCRMMGFGGGQSTSVPYNITHVPTFLHGVNCNGFETDLDSCMLGGELHERSCYAYQTAHVTCDKPAPPHVDTLKLVGGVYPWMGLLEINTGGVWGTACSQTWDVHSTAVACKSLGFKSKHYFFENGAYYGNNTGPIVIPAVRCTGDEATLNDCTIEPTSLKTTCTHDDDVAIRCVDYDLGGTMSVSCHEHHWDIEINMVLLRALHEDEIGSHQISLGPPECVGQLFGNVLRFNQSVKSCFTQRQNNGTADIYHNRLAYNSRLNDTSITLVTKWKHDIYCVDANIPETTTEATTTAPLTTTVNPASLQVQVSYLSSDMPPKQIYGNPLDIPSATTVYVTVTPALPLFRLVVKNCSAVVDGDVSHPWEILLNGCQIDNSMILLRVADAETKFMFQATWFTGTKSMSVSCQAITTCTANDQSPDCRQGCNVQGHLIG